jgi:hypothetical protein
MLGRVEGSKVELGFPGMDEDLSTIPIPVHKNIKIVCVCVCVLHTIKAIYLTM